MALITNYTTLVSAVVDLFEDESAEFRSYIPTAIGLAESQLIREFDTQGIQLEADVTASAGKATIAKPSGLRASYNLEYENTSSGEFVQVPKKTRGWCRDYWPVSASTGNPKYYFDKSNTTIQVVPTPDTGYVFSFTYHGKPTALSSANSTNYFTDYIPDTLFYCVAVHQAIFSRNDKIQSKAQSAYDRGIEGLVNEARRNRRDNESSPNNPEGGPNTLAKNST